MSPAGTPEATTSVVALNHRAFASVVVVVVVLAPDSPIRTRRAADLRARARAHAGECNTAFDTFARRPRAPSSSTKSGGLILKAINTGDK